MDQDGASSNCAKDWNGGWWYNVFLSSFFLTQTNPDDRYNVCHNAHPTGHSTAKKKRGNGKYVDYYRGGARGDTFQSWAEAEYLLLPS